MDGFVEVAPSKFVHYRVYEGSVYLMADDVARAVGYASNRRNGQVTSLYGDTGIGMVVPRSYLFYEGEQRIFWNHTAFNDFTIRSAEFKGNGKFLLLGKIRELYDTLKHKKHMNTQASSLLEEKQSTTKALLLRAYILDGVMYLKFDGEVTTRTTVSYKDEGAYWSFEIKKKGYGKYKIEKEQVKQF